MGKQGRRLAALGASVLAAGVGGAYIAARRERVSLRGWLASHLLVPILYGKRRTMEEFRIAIADNRARGPALPSNKIRTRYRFLDGHVSGSRCFRLSPAKGKTGGTRILYLHGGAYVFDLMGVQWPIITGLVDRCGAEVVAPIYPLAPEATVEQALATVEAVFLKLVGEVGAGNVTIVGDSAGGGLALALAQRLRDSGQPLPAALVLFFPWLDLTCCDEDQPGLIEKEPLLSVTELREAGRMWAGGADPATAPASPLFADQAGLPPILALVGTRDMLVSDTRRLAACSGNVTAREYTGMFHGWVCAPIPEAYHALDEAAHFLRDASA